MRRALGIAAALFAVAGCSTLDKLNPFSGSSSAPKPAELQPIKPSAQFQTLWQAAAGSAGAFVFTPAVDGGTVFAAAADGTVARFDDGRRAWSAQAGSPLSAGVGSDGSRVVVATLKGEVVAFDGSGKESWRARVTSEVLGAPAVAGDLVLVRSGDNRIFAFDAANGTRRWVYQRASPPLVLRSHVGMTVGATAIYAGFPGGKLVAISPANGAALWEATVALPRGATELERIADVTSEPQVFGRSICAAAFQGRVACFDADTGSALWAREMSSTAGVDSDGRYLFVADEKGAVHALDLKTGASIWRNDKLYQRGLSRPVVLGQFVVVGDSQGIVHALQLDDGAFAARITTDGSAVVASPVRTAQGVLVQTKAGGLHSLALR